MESNTRPSFSSFSTPCVHARPAFLLSWLLKNLPGPDGLLGEILEASQGGVQVEKQDLELRGRRTQEAWPVARLRGRTEVFIAPGRGSVVSRGFCQTSNSLSRTQSLPGLGSFCLRKPSPPNVQKAEGVSQVEGRGDVGPGCEIVKQQLHLSTVVISAFIQCVRQIAKHMIYAFLIVNPSDILQGTISKSSQKWLCFFLFLD